MEGQVKLVSSSPPKSGLPVPEKLHFQKAMAPTSPSIAVTAIAVIQATSIFFSSNHKKSVDDQNKSYEKLTNAKVFYPATHVTRLQASV